MKGTGFDAEAVWRRVERDMTLLRQLIAIFEREFPQLLAEMKVAIESGNAPALEKAAHKIKGTMLQFAADRAGAAALELEELGRSGTVAGAKSALEKLAYESDLLLNSLRMMVSGTAE